jgi:hypothetical protein
MSNGNSSHEHVQSFGVAWTSCATHVVLMILCMLVRTTTFLVEVRARVFMDIMRQPWYRNNES